MKRRVLALFLLIAIIAGTFTGCAAENSENFQSMKDFEQAKVGVLTGSSFDLLAKEYLPHAEKLSYMNITDLILNLKQDKIDGILMDEGLFTPLRWEDDELSFVKMDSIPETEYAVAFPKTADSEPLQAQMNEFIATCTQTGWIDELAQKWFGVSEPEDVLDFSQLTGENGTLRVATTVESKPFDYLKNGRFVGFDADFIYQFAKEYGYALEIDTMDFGALLPSLAAERYDLAISSITVTEERKESVLFSDTYYKSPIIMAVLRDNTSAGTVKTVADLEHATIGIVTGHSWDLIAQKNYPNAERKYFSSEADALLALSQGKIDALLVDKTVYAGVRWENSAISCIDESIGEVSNALIFAKEGYDENLLAQVNAFIAKAKENGTLERLSAKWFADTEPEDHPDYTRLSGQNGTLRIAVCEGQRPVTYQRGTMYTGYEVDFLTLFAEEYGYQLDFQGMSFDALIPSVATGKCDIGACGITVTPERSESVTFADPHFETYGVAVIRNQDVGKADEKTLTDFAHAKIGIITGSSHDGTAKSYFPNAERVYFNSLADMIIAVEQKKIDCYLEDAPFLTALIWEGVNLKRMEEAVSRVENGFVFPEGEGTYLREQINVFLSEAKADGTIERLKKKWMGSAEPEEHPDYMSLKGENGTIRLATAIDGKPLLYQREDYFTGFEMELLTLFGQYAGYAYDIEVVPFESIIAGIAAGKYDMGAAALNITSEREESVDFSDPYASFDVVMVVAAEENSVAQTGFWDDVRESFEKTFIREDRWKLIVKGVGVTMLISICAAAAGSLLGFGLYMLSRADAKVLQLLARGIAKVYSRIVAGTPVVVILMILFYVIFGKVRDMSGIVVAIIGFTLTFGAFVYDHMTVSVGNVDRGQTEAAYALGYTKNKTFFRIVFPQAMNVFLPSYCGQAVELIKATAVVGYVAVNDLTKMGDIIRSNTYEAFFPLIATAVIYFLLTWMLSALLGLVQRRFEPKRRCKESILKGVKTV